MSQANNTNMIQPYQDLMESSCLFFAPHHNEEQTDDPTQFVPDCDMVQTKAANFH